MNARDQQAMIDKSIAVRCHRCHWLFLPDEPEERVCPECRKLERPKRQKQLTFKPSKPSRCCRVCGKQFIPRRRTTTICSTECARRSQWMILERDDFQCIYCGKKSYNNRSELHIDHVFPCSKGGADTADNLATACAECNLAKGTKIIGAQDAILAEIAKRNRTHGIAPKQYISLRSVQLIEKDGKQ